MNYHSWKYQDDSFFNRCRKCGCNRVMNIGTPSGNERFIYYYDGLLKPIYFNPQCKKQKNEKITNKDTIGTTTLIEEKANHIMGCD